MTRNFAVSFEVEDNDPTGDNRDEKAIRSIILSQFHLHAAYHISRLNIEEIITKKEPNENQT